MPGHLRQLSRRVTRLARATMPQRKGYLLVSRYPEETEAAALARCRIEPDAWSQVRIRPWIGGRIAPRLAMAPEPVWIPTAYTPQDTVYLAQRTQQANARIMRLRREQTGG
jgi:hypothetical protein